jgi:RNA polymerase sigma factor (sigma-70 family)
VEGVVMPAEDDVAELLTRAKTGDQAAVAEFLTRFENELRMMIRARLPKKLRTRFDSTDFAQAVWQSFFTRLKHNLQNFENIDHLRGYLSGVVRNKVQEQHRRLTRTGKYDVSREQPLYVRRGDREVPRDVVSPEPSPSQAAQADDRLAQLTAGCSPLEVEVIRLRYAGLTFDEIAARTGIHERAARRVIDSARARMEAHKWQ